MNDFQQLKQEYANCQRCAVLVKNRTQVVFGSGNEKAQILFIGEAPGAQEDKQGIPFCGSSGQILTQLLTSVGLTREDIFITNTILCRPPDNRNPLPEEIENCRSRLDKLIQIMQPKVIVTLGNFAAKRILNQTASQTGINKIRGKIFSLKINQQEIKVVPVVHPASYLYSGRNPEQWKEMQHDFRIIANLVHSNKAQKDLTQY